MSIPSSLTPLFNSGSSGAGGLQIERSLRFNPVDTPYLRRVFSGNGSNMKIRTFSCWVKRSGLGVTKEIFSNYGTAGHTRLNFETDTLYAEVAGALLQTTQVFRDVSAWYHILFAWDTTQATSSNRSKLYVNGTQITTFSTEVYPTQNADTNFATTDGNSIIGQYQNMGGYVIDGYLANIHFIDGQALTPSSFTETDATTGQLIPKTYTGTYGTNGFNLLFADNSNNTASTLGKDSSPNGNNWTPNNLSVTAGAGNDSLVDSPTNYGTDTYVGGEVRGNYCTWNAVNKSANTTLSNGNLNATSAVADWRAVLGTVGMSSGKWYWEQTIAGSSLNMHGIAKQGVNLEAYIGTDANGWAYYGNSGTYNNSNLINTSTFASYTGGDVIGIAFDADNGSLYFYKNGTVQNSGSPAYTGLTSGPYFPAASHFNSSSSDVNFGQRAFAYQTPGTNRPAATFLALCTQNLPAPLVTKSNTVMDVALWTGTGVGGRAVTGLNFNPDLVWLKRRSSGGANSHQLHDVVRTASAGALYSDLTNAEDSNYPITSFDTAGFTLGNSASLASQSYASQNETSQTYVGWAWDAGTSTVSNTAGSITSQVRANASAGFSVISYTGNGSGGSTIGHGLGVAPAFAIFKNRSTSSDWQVYHVSLGNANSILLQSTAAAVSSSAFNSTSPTSTVITLGAGTSLNNNGSNHICYAWTPVVGYSNFGSYTGNGSSDGSFVYTGFRPRWVMIKRSDSASSTYGWFILDTARNTYNVMNTWLAADSSTSDGADVICDTLSNGFKIRTTAGNINTNAGTFIYAAFAEAPINYSRAR
jgi:hypothetical protein